MLRSGVHRVVIVLDLKSIYKHTSFKTSTLFLKALKHIQAIKSRLWDKICLSWLHAWQDHGSAGKD